MWPCPHNGDTVGLSGLVAGVSHLRCCGSAVRRQPSPHLLQKVAELEAYSLFLYIRSLILGIAKIRSSSLSLTLTLELKPPVALCNWG